MFCFVCLFFVEEGEQVSVVEAGSKSSTDGKEVSQKDAKIVEKEDMEEMGKMIEEERSETGRVST